MLLRTPVAVVAAGLIVIGLSGCGGDDSSPQARAATDVPAALTAAPTTAAPSMPEPLSVETPPADTADPALPPGDPGTTAPSVGEVTSAPSHVDGPKPSVPADAVLDAVTMGQVAGGRWSVGSAPGDSCATPRPTDSIASRTTGLTSAGTRMVETVAIHRDKAAASRAVAALASRAKRCGWHAAADLPMGEESAGFSRSTASGPERLVIVAAEGVSVTVIGDGKLAEDDNSWASVLDIAIGTSCPAAPDGCH